MSSCVSGRAEGWRERHQRERIIALTWTSQPGGMRFATYNFEVTDPGPPSVVAVFNSNQDVVEMLRISLEHAGFLAVTGHITKIVRGTLDVERFVQQHQPSVIVYDIAPPYERNWQFLQHLRRMPDVGARPFVLTSTHAAYLQELVGADEMVHEILGKPYDIDAVINAVRAAARPRTRPS
jgi:CheY-like chemotaxis protein